jgi:hypothetical protein
MRFKLRTRARAELELDAEGLRVSNGEVHVSLDDGHQCWWEHYHQRDGEDFQKFWERFEAELGQLVDRVVSDRAVPE